MIIENYEKFTNVNGKKKKTKNSFCLINMHFVLLKLLNVSLIIEQSASV